MVNNQLTLCVCVSHLGLPHEPKLKDVHMPATLNGLVPRVVGDVVLFVWLEQVACTHAVTARQDSLYRQTYLCSNLVRKHCGCRV